jgi:hypothetical protein
MLLNLTGKPWEEIGGALEGKTLFNCSGWNFKFGFVQSKRENNISRPELDTHNLLSCG